MAGVRVPRDQVEEQRWDRVGTVPVLENLQALHKHLELSNLLAYFSKCSVWFGLLYVFSCLLAKIYEVSIM